jgi:Tfp pilus assembly protein PilO
VTRNHKILIAVAVTAAAVAAYWFLLLAPKRAEIVQLDADVAVKQEAAQQANSIVATYEKARGAYKSNYATVVRLGKAVPGDDDVRSLMYQVDDAAGRTGVDFSSIQVGTSSGASSDAAKPAAGGATPPPGATVVGEAGFWAMPFELTFNGSYGELGDFFSRVERFVTVADENVNVSGRLLRIEAFSLETDAESYPSINASIGATSYIVPPSEGVTNKATPAGPASTATPASSSGPAGAPTTTATGVLR